MPVTVTAVDQHQSCNVTIPSLIVILGIHKLKHGLRDNKDVIAIRVEKCPAS
jgi:hypothetical protein